MTLLFAMIISHENHEKVQNKPINFIMTRKIHPSIWLCPALAVIFFSCAASPQVKETPPNPPTIETIIEETPPEVYSIENKSQPIEAKAQETPQAAASPQENTIASVTPYSLVPEGFTWNKQLPPAQAPVKPEKPEVPEFIMGKGVISPEAMSAFLLAANSGADKEFVENLAFFYIEEAAVEGINHDTAFAQMCLETGFLSFTGLVSPEQNNFCGLGAIGPGQPGEWFPDPRTGVRAHIQHLKAYATDTPLNQELVDPRYFLVSFGSSPAIRGLAGTWAADRLYAEKIANILERLYNFAYGI
jgi:hypothetical protein